MMKRPIMIRLTLSATIILILFLISGCGKSPNEKLIGTWIDDGQNIIEFFEDGSFSLKPNCTLPIYDPDVCGQCAAVIVALSVQGALPACRP